MTSPKGSTEDACVFEDSFVARPSIGSRRDLWRRTDLKASGRIHVSEADRLRRSGWTLCHRLVSGRFSAQTGPAHSSTQITQTASVAGLKLLVWLWLNPNSARAGSGPTS